MQQTLLQFESMTPGHTDVTMQKKIVGIDYGKIVHDFKVHFQVIFQSSTLEGF